MASVCGGCLAMMLAGVPLSQPIAGIAMGLVQEGDQTAILSDIQGSEDRGGDMDFKVAGSGIGITALQMDIKVKGVSYRQSTRNGGGAMTRIERLHAALIRENTEYERITVELLQRVLRSPN